MFFTVTKGHFWKLKKGKWVCDCYVHTGDIPLLDKQYEKELLSSLLLRWRYFPLPPFFFSHGFSKIANHSHTVTGTLRILQVTEHHTWEETKKAAAGWRNDTRHTTNTTTFSFCFSHFKILKARIIPQRRTLSPFFHLPPFFPLCFVLHITFRPFDYTCRLLNRRPVLGSHCYAHRLIHFPKREGRKKKERRLTGLEQWTSQRTVHDMSKIREFCETPASAGLTRLLCVEFSWGAYHSSPPKKRNTSTPQRTVEIKRI